MSELHRIEIPAQQRLDPITVYADNLGNNKGMLTVVCFGAAWSAYWGSMGTDDVREFVADSNAGYLHDNLTWSINQFRRPTKSDRDYLMRVCVAVREALQPFAKRRAA